jgi:hypothetical protein
MRRKEQMQRLGYLRAALAATAVFLVLTSAATAGTYPVYGACGNWGITYNNSPTGVAAYPQCPGLVLRNVLGAFSTPAGAEGRWVFTAPPGTLITQFFSVVNPYAGSQFEGLNGWQVTAFSLGGRSGSNGYVFKECPGSSCPGATSTLGQFGIPDATSLELRLRCGKTPTCPNNGLFGAIVLSDVTVTLNDVVAPSVQIAGGSLAAPGWHSGTQVVSVAASDNTGISAVRAYLDGAPRADQPRPACHWDSIYPCPNSGGDVAVSTAGLSDGAHTLTIVGVDSGGNTAADSRTIYVDNTAPAQPRAAILDGGPQWRPTNGFVIRWTPSAGEAAPITSIVYRICPSGSSDASKCVSGERAPDSPGALSLTVPGPGDWSVKFWMRDAAGNADPATAATLDHLRFDPTPPAAAIALGGVDDPTQIRVVASDAVSFIASGEVEIQRDGESDWHGLPTTVTSDGLVATLDDSQFRNGPYTIRAHVVDAAGNERTTTSLIDGNPARVTLPLRLVTELAVGKPERVRAGTARGGRPRYKRILVKRPRAGFGRTVRLRGRLTTPGGNPLANVGVGVWEKVELPGATWVHLADLTTSRTGRLSYRALRGPSRLVQFRYAGTATIRPRVATVEMLVRGWTTFKVDRHHVFNGEDVVFSGRVHGRPFPQAGKLVELQVYTRRKWRTFAQPRASATSGRWSYDYRFDTVQGREAFRFRARLRKEQGYPYELGMSREVRVVVRGL